VTPGKGGQTFEGTRPVSTRSGGRARNPANTSVIYVPAAVAASAIFEAATPDRIDHLHYGRHSRVGYDERRCRCERRARLIGPNCPGLISRQEKVGIIPGNICHAREDRRRVAQRHADLRDHPPALRRTDGTVDVRWHRR